MDDVYAQVNRAVPAIVRTLALLLALELSLLLLLSPEAPLSERMLFRAAVLLVLAMMLFPFSTLTMSGGSVQSALWSVAVSAVFLAGVALSDSAALATIDVWLLAAGTGLLACLFGSISSGLAALLEDRRAASRITLTALLLSLSLPLWSSPIAALFGACRWLVDLLVALCPMAYLASLAGIDYLRGDWFYQHTPYGGLRYDYPDPLLLSGTIVLLIAVLWRFTRRWTAPSSITSPANSMELSQ